jgi:hypothetical protein
MKSKKSYQKGDKVLVKSFAAQDVIVTLQHRYLTAEHSHKLGVDGWDAQIILSREVNKLRKNGVPYKKGEKPKVWVFDWQIIRKCN